MQEQKPRTITALFQSEAQPGAQGVAGLRFGLFSPSLVRPRPLARALGMSSVRKGGLHQPKRPAGYKCNKLDCDSFFECVYSDAYYTKSLI